MLENTSIIVLNKENTIKTRKTGSESEVLTKYK